MTPEEIEEKKAGLRRLDQESLIEHCLNIYEAAENNEKSWQDYCNQLEESNKKGKKRLKLIFITLMVICTFIVSLATGLFTALLMKDFNKEKIQKTNKLLNSHFILQNLVDSLKIELETKTAALQDCQQKLQKTPGKKSPGKKLEQNQRGRGKQAKGLMMPQNPIPEKPQVPPPPAPPEINADSLALFSPEENLENPGKIEGSARGSGNEVIIRISPDRSGKAYKKPTIYGRSGKNKTYSNYGKSLKVYQR